MYSQQEIDDAVSAGAMTPDAAASLRRFVANQRSTNMVDEEQVRLITGFNDIFVTIAAAIMLFAVGAIGYWIGVKANMSFVPNEPEGPSFLSPLLVAATAWMLALFFTAKKRMALPSILLTFAFVGGTFGAVFMALASILFGTGLIDQNSNNASIPAAIAAASAAFAVGGAYLHYQRFRVPVTVAAGAVAAAAIILALVGALTLGNSTAMLITALVMGVTIFLLAMRWDGSDRSRITRRSDVAFWLHLAAAPLIVHPIFTLLGLTDGALTTGGGLLAIGLYVLLAMASLAIDRRALLVSALAYVLVALTSLFKNIGAVELNIALTALVIGSGLLLLSAFWHQARGKVLGLLPADLIGRLPAADPTLSPTPAA